VLSILGLALITFSTFEYHDGTPFPSVYTLVPVIGTALVILFAAQDTWVSRILRLRGFVGIGLISYSAYLWHQPLFAFARLRSINEPSQELMAALAVASLLLAWATWYWVEQAFRRRLNPLLVTRSVFAASGIVCAVLVAVGLTGYLGKGFEWRFNGDILRLVQTAHDTPPFDCHFGRKKNLPTHPVIECQHISPEGNEKIILLGDSHAHAVSVAVGSLLKNRGISFYEVSYAECVPLRGLRLFDEDRKHECAEFNDAVYNYARSSGASTVVLTARFPLYLNGSGYNNGEGGVEDLGRIFVDLVERSESHWNDDARRARVLAQYEEQIRELAKSFNVVLVYPVPEAGWDVPSYAFKNAYFNVGGATITTSYAAYIERTREVNALFDHLVAELPKVHGARIHEVLCNDTTGRCINADEVAAYYYDDDHLSSAGARLVAPVIVGAIEGVLQSEQSAQTE
jgi:hypothetical protein